MKKNKNITVLEKIEVFLFFIYILIFYIFGADPIKIKYSEVILVIFLGIELFKIIKMRKIKFAWITIVLILFSFYCFLSNFWAVNAEYAIDRAKTMIILTAFLLISFNFFINLENSEEILLKIIMYVGFIFSIYIILYYGIDTYFSKLITGERVGKEINNVNAIGLQTAISCIISVFYMLYTNQKKYLLIALFPLIVALGTGSRKVILLLVIGSLLLLFLKRDEKIQFKKILNKAILLMLFMGFFLIITKSSFFTSSINRFNSIINELSGEGKIDTSIMLRKKYIEAGMKEFNNKPILGNGAGNSGYITLTVSNNFTYLHNNFVELLATTGLIGFLLYYSLYIYIIIYCVKFLKKKNKYINITLIVFIINIILEFGMVSYYNKNTYIYILLALITIERIKMENKNEENIQIYKKS